VTMQDKTLTCVECGYEFTFTSGEQEFFASRGYTNEPKRCTQCRGARKSQQRSSGGFGDSYGSAREMHPAVCAQCGKDTMVPFRPRGDKPVYCSDCFSGMRSDSYR
jgi:CxxC-x17-CxxC domain-containing protein